MNPVPASLAGRPAKGRPARPWAPVFTAGGFLLPAVVILGAFSLFPALYSLYLSLHRWQGLAPEAPFVGLENYARLVHDAAFWSSLKATALFAGGMTLGALALGLAYALLLNGPVLGRGAYRVLFFLPVITPSVAAGTVWRYLFDPSQGVVNSILATFGIAGPHWLVDPAWALLAVALVGIWRRVGFNIIIYLAALQDIPRELHEAARVDGASSWETLRFVTVPLLSPTTFFLVVTSLIEGFQVFDLVYVMTQGGPLGSTDVLGFFLYRNAFSYLDLGYASAIAYAMFAIILAVTLVQQRLSRAGGAYA
ncbi:MAG TPA: sugar ABC transporter permease [Deinococcales bacterium]|nr:sugar ABC transporter permease [Deinococcales bacterium]